VLTTIVRGWLLALRHHLLMESLADQFVISGSEAWVLLGAGCADNILLLTAGAVARPHLRFLRRRKGVLHSGLLEGAPMQAVHVVRLERNCLKVNLVVFFFFNFINFSWVEGLGRRCHVPTGDRVGRFAHGLPMLAALCAVRVGRVGLEGVHSVLVEVSRRLFQWVGHR